MDKLKSRKLWVTVGGLLLVAGGALTGSLSVGDAVDKGIVLVVGYLAAEGAADAFSRPS